MANVTINQIDSTAQDIQNNDIFIIWDASANSNNGGTSQVSSTAIKNYMTEGLASTETVETMIQNAMPSTSTISENTVNIGLLADWIRAFYEATEDNEGTITIPSTADNDANWVSYLFPSE